MKRKTPYFDNWISRVTRDLSPYGCKAELARHLSVRYGRPARSWESNLGKIIARTMLPNAEVLLAIEAWLARQKPPKQKNGR